MVTRIYLRTLALWIVAICNAFFSSVVMAQGDGVKMWNICGYCFDFRTGTVEVSPLTGINRKNYPVFWYVDSEGTLRLVFSNGSVYNGEGILLDGGENIISENHQTSVRFVPVPSKNLVYSFLDSKYLIIDLDKNEIVSEHQFDIGWNDVNYMLTVCHANGNDIWIIDCSKDSIYKYLLTSDGLSLHEIVPWPDGMANAKSNINLSRNGTHFVTRYDFNVVYGTFDRSTANFTITSVHNLEDMVVNKKSNARLMECALSWNNECIYLFAINVPNYIMWQINILDGIPDCTSPITIAFEDFIPGVIPVSRTYYGPDGKTYMVVGSKGFVRALTYNNDGASTFVDYQVDSFSVLNSLLPKQTIALFSNSLPTNPCENIKIQNPVIIKE